MQEEKYDFLHIGKTGGNFFRNIVRKIDKKDKKIIIRGHNNSILNDEIKNRVIFFVRNPTTRFISGFISRLRKGRPVNNSKWSKNEEIAFNNFKTPNELAEALSSSDKKNI